MKTVLACILLTLTAVFAGVASDTNAPTCNSPENLLSTKYFHIRTENFMAKVKKTTPPKESETESQLLKRYFIKNSTEISSISYNARKGILYVHATKEDLEKVEALVEKLDKVN